MTNNNQHTPGPWTVYKEQMVLGKPPKNWRPTQSEPEYIVTQTRLYTSPDRETANANAARIVACVNACEGLNPEAVRELLEALHTISNKASAGLLCHADAPYCCATIGDIARAALAKATEKSKEAGAK
jgi:hypothetical protein